MLRRQGGEWRAPGYWEGRREMSIIINAPPTSRLQRLSKRSRMSELRDNVIAPRPPRRQEIDCRRSVSEAIMRRMKNAA